MSSSTHSPHGEASPRAPSVRRPCRLALTLSVGALLTALTYTLWPHAGTLSPSPTAALSPPNRAAPCPTSAGPLPPTSPAERDAALATRWQHWLAKSPIPELVIAGMGPWLQSATADELVAALQSLLTVTPTPSAEMRASLCRALLCQLAGLDGEVAIEVTKAVAVSGARVALENAVYAAWAATDPDGALAHLVPRFDREVEDVSGMLTGVLQQVARNDPARAAVLAKDYARAENSNLHSVGLRYRQERFGDRFKDLADVDGAFRAVAQETLSPKEAESWRSEILEWARMAKDRDLVARVLGKVTDISNVWAMRDAVSALAASHPELVRAFIERTEADPMLQGDAFRYAVANSTLPQQAATVDWLLARPPTPRRNVLLEQAATILGSKDIPLALRAVEAMQDGPKKIELHYSLGFKLLEAEPARARAQLPPEMVANYDKLIATGRVFGLQQLPGTTIKLTFDFSATKPGKRP